MGTLIRFPQEKTRFPDDEPRGSSALIIILPVVRVERDDQRQRCLDAFARLREQILENHMALLKGK